MIRDALQPARRTAVHGAAVTLFAAAAGTWAASATPCAHAAAPVAAPAAVPQGATPAAHHEEFLLVRRSMQVESVRLMAITELSLEYFDPSGVKPYVSVPLSECIALLNPGSAPRSRSRGLLTLNNQQRLPGEAIVGVPPSGDVLAWSHPWLGRVDVPIDTIESMVLAAGVKPPAQGEADVVLLANGDRQTGLVASLGDPMSIDVGEPGQARVISIPLNLVAAVTMVSPRKPVLGRRIWFDEGTIIDVQSIAVGDDGYVRLAGAAVAAGTQTTKVGLSQIAAILLDPQGMVPLATLAPSRVEGPPTRYVLPRPDILDPAAPLGLSRVSLRGPLVARYAVPAGIGHLTAQAELPASAREWGDVELVIRSDDAEVFRARLNAASPTVAISAPLTGRELSIELLESAHGPVQDQVILHRAMLLKKA